MTSIDRPRPLVAVAHPTVQDYTTGEPVEIPEAWELTCSEHGTLTDWEDVPAKRELQRRARRHADEHHDGDVDAEGWAR